MTRYERLGDYASRLVGPEYILTSAAAATEFLRSPIVQRNGLAEPKLTAGALGNSFAQHVIRETLQYGISATLHEDNRYFASGAERILCSDEICGDEHAAGTARQREPNILLFAHRRHGWSCVYFSRMAAPQHKTAPAMGPKRLASRWVPRLGLTWFASFCRT